MFARAGSIALASTLTLPGILAARADDGQIQWSASGGESRVQVLGGKKEEWRFQVSEDLAVWTNAPALGTVFAGTTNLQSVPLNTTGAALGFIRAIKTDGLFDTNLLRTVSLTFTNANWA